MPKDYPPPSRAEQQRLIRERSTDKPRPAPAPRPSGCIGAVVDASVARMRAERSEARERRLFTIDRALSTNKHVAKTDLAKVKDKGAVKAQAVKMKAKSRERVGR